MDKLLGKWKFHAFVGLDGKEIKDEDDEMARMRLIFMSDGTIKEGFIFPDEVTPDVQKELDEAGYTYQDGVIITDEKKWEVKDGVIYSSIASVPKSATELSDMGPLEFDGEYLKYFMMFAFVLLERD